MRSDNTKIKEALERLDEILARAIADMGSAK